MTIKYPDEKYTYFCDIFEWPPGLLLVDFFEGVLFSEVDISQSSKRLSSSSINPSAANSESNFLLIFFAGVSTNCPSLFMLHDNCPETLWYFLNGIGNCYLKMWQEILYNMLTFVIFWNDHQDFSRQLIFQLQRPLRSHLLYLPAYCRSVCYQCCFQKKVNIRQVKFVRFSNLTSIESWCVPCVFDVYCHISSN